MHTKLKTQGTKNLTAIKLDTPSRILENNNGSCSSLLDFLYTVHLSIQLYSLPTNLWYKSKILFFIVKQAYIFNKFSETNWMY